MRAINIHMFLIPDGNVRPMGRRRRRSWRRNAICSL